MPDHRSLLDQINQSEGISLDEIQKVLTENPSLYSRKLVHLDESYIKHYLECGKSGKDDDEFEELTRKIFEKMGFKTEKLKIGDIGGAGKPEIDGLIKNSQILKSGILECKSGAGYTFPRGDSDKMSTTYIPSFKEFKSDGKNYHLDFFVYVIGTKATGLGNFEDILNKTNVHGTVIYARDLLSLYEKYITGVLTQNDVWNIFKLNKHLTEQDFLK